MGGQVEEWIDGKVEEWIVERVDRWRSGQVEQRIRGRLDMWKTRQVEDWIGGKVDRRKTGQAEKWIGGRVDRWIGGRVDKSKSYALWKGGSMNNSESYHPYALLGYAYWSLNMIMGLALALFSCLVAQFAIFESLFFLICHWLQWWNFARSTRFVQSNKIKECAEGTKAPS